MALLTTHFKQYERMTEPSQSCFIDQCQSLPHSVCNHCDQHFCQDHSNEHKNRCNQTVSYLTDIISQFTARLSSIEPYCFEELERWRMEAYRSIDRYCNKKTHDLFEKKQENLKEELVHLQKKLDEERDVIDNEFYQINDDIQLIEMKLIELEHLRLTFRPWFIEDTLITSQHLFLFISYISQYSFESRQ